MDPPEGDHAPTASRDDHLTIAYTLTASDL